MLLQMPPSVKVALANDYDSILMSLECPYMCMCVCVCLSSMFLYTTVTHALKHINADCYNIQSPGTIPPDPPEASYRKYLTMMTKPELCSANLRG